LGKFKLLDFLQHTKAMHLLEAGVNLFYIKGFLGHEDISTTEVCAKVSILLIPAGNTNYNYSLDG